MTIDTVRDYCLAKPDASEGTPFGDTVLVFKAGGKMFALLGLDGPPWTANLKCDPPQARGVLRSSTRSGRLYIPN